MTAVVLFAIGLGSCLAAAAVAHRWIVRPLEQSSRAKRVQQQREQRIADVQARLDRVPAAPDNTEGINRGDWDDCELMLAATNDIEAGLDRLFTQLGNPPRKEEQ